MEEKIAEDSHISELMSGKRPEGMSKKEFKIKRKAIQKFINEYKRGRIFYEGPGSYKK